MYLSLNGVPIGGHLAWPDFARLASRTGFKGVDVMLEGSMTEGVDRTRRLFEDLHLRPAFVNLPVDFRKDDAAFRATLPKLEDAGPFAAAIGCPRMMTAIMSSSDTPKDELRRTYKKRLTECANILARSHCRLGLEFLGPLHFRQQFKYEFIWKMTDMLEFAKECGSNVGLTLDAWHWHHSGGTPADILAAGKERIVVVHFDDAANLPANQVRDNQRLLPGEGVIDLTGFLAALQKIGYQDSLSVEVFGRGLKEMPPEQSAKLCLEYGRAALKKAGIVET
ncbi:MAG: xylose isomerase [Acidobacteria bacterium]|jgi:sugar phosphate isomerase/epimerase|nr:MAG: xylose isomerase [Acidobacteriota bacterium]